MCRIIDLSCCIISLENAAEFPIFCRTLSEALHLAGRPVQGSVAKCQLFSQATYMECRTQQLTRIDFQISLNPDWQIDDGFLKG